MKKSKNDIPFKWEDFLNYAKKIKEEGDSKSWGNIGIDFCGEQEASCRIGVSRAYYAAFNIAENFLVSYFPNKISFYKTLYPKEPHKAVISTLRNLSNKDLSDIGERLNSFRIQRFWADYHLDIYIGHGINPFKELEDAVKYAEDILKKIEEQSNKILKDKIKSLTKKKN